MYAYPALRFTFRNENITSNYTHNYIGNPALLHFRHGEVLSKFALVSELLRTDKLFENVAACFHMQTLE